MKTRSLRIYSTALKLVAWIAAGAFAVWLIIAVLFRCLEKNNEVYLFRSLGSYAFTPVILTVCGMLSAYMQTGVFCENNVSGKKAGLAILLTDTLFSAVFTLLDSINMRYVRDGLLMYGHSRYRDIVEGLKNFMDSSWYIPFILFGQFGVCFVFFMAGYNIIHMYICGKKAKGIFKLVYSILFFTSWLIYGFGEEEVMKSGIGLFLCLADPTSFVFILYMDTIKDGVPSLPILTIPLMIFFSFCVLSTDIDVYSHRKDNINEQQD